MPVDQMTFGSLHLISCSLSTVPRWINSHSASELSESFVSLLRQRVTSEATRTQRHLMLSVWQWPTFALLFFQMSLRFSMENLGLAFWTPSAVILETLWLLIACCVFPRQNDALTVLWPSSWTAPKQIKHKMKEARKRHLSHGSYAANKWPELKVSSGLSSRLRPLWLSKSHFNHGCNLKLH